VFDPSFTFIVLAKQFFAFDPGYAPGYFHRMSEVHLSLEDPTLGFLHQIGSRMAAADPLHEVLQRIVDFVSSVVQCDSCLVYVLESNELVLRASKNPHPEVVDRLKMSVGQGITGWVAEHLKPVAVASDASKDSRFRHFNELPEDRFEAFLSVPIISRNKLVGVINVQNRQPHAFSQSEIQLISTIGFLVGAEIERARLEEENSQLSEELESRKIIERGKGILQRDLKLSEEEAYLMLQKQSRQRRMSMREVAEAIILNDEIRKAQSKSVPS
jgi:signal transduction protein with GAF and PtsI domain